jgi:hypothetical protein
MSLRWVLSDGIIQHGDTEDTEDAQRKKSDQDLKSLFLDLDRASLKTLAPLQYHFRDCVFTRMSYRNMNCRRS